MYTHNYLWTTRTAIRQEVTEDEPGTFEATASAFDSTATGEKGPTRFAPTAFDSTVKARPTVVLLWQHQDTAPIGTAALRVVPGHGLVAKCRLALGTKLADEAHALLKLGALNSVSIGFTPKPGAVEQRGDHRLIRDCDVMEVSLVTFGADPAARVRTLHRSWVEWYTDPRAQGRREYETVRAAQAEAQARHSTSGAW